MVSAAVIFSSCVVATVVRYLIYVARAHDSHIRYSHFAIEMF
jgi:hypothetical protein